MEIDEIEIGIRVRTKLDFCCVPKGSEGVLDEDYGTGVMVAWDIPGQSVLPKGYKAYDGKWACVTGILRDGFDKETELEFLEVVK